MKTYHSTANSNLQSKNTSTTQSKRSTHMKHNRYLTFAAMFFFAIIIVPTGLFSQGNVVLSGTTNNTGTIKLKGTLSGGENSIGGTVEFNNAGTQTIPAGKTFTNLTASGGTGDKTLAGATTVTGTLTVNNLGQKLVLGGSTLNYSGTGALVVSAGTFDFTSGTVNYSANAAQTIHGTTYQNLTTSGASGSLTKSAGGNVTVTGTLTNGASTTLDFASNTFAANSGAAFANSAILKSSGTVTITDATTVVNGNFEYAGTQTVAPAYYTGLTLSGGTKTFTSGATYKVAGVYNVGGGARTYTGSTFEYNSPVAAQTIVDESYANLILSDAGVKNITSGTVAATGTFVHSSGALTLNGGNLTLGTTGSFAGLTITSGNLTGGSGTATFNNNVTNGGTIAAGVGNLDFLSTAALTNTGTIALDASEKMYLASTFTNTAGTLNFDATSEVHYISSTSQSIANAIYGKLILANSDKTIGSSTVSTLLTASSNVAITTALTISTAATFTGNLTNSGSITTTGSSVTFDGGSQTIGGNAISFNNLTLAGSAAKTSSVDLTVGGTFTPTRGLDITGKTLAVNGTVGTYGSLEEVKGTMIVAAPSAATYTLNNASTTVVFSGAEVGRTFGLTVNPGVNPTGTFDAATDVNRKIAVSHANWATGTADLKLAYTFAERTTSGLNDSKLRDFKNDHTVSGNKIATGFALTRVSAVSGVSFGTVDLPGITPGAGTGSIASSDLVILSARSAAFMSIAAADWNTASTWDEGTVPTISDDVVINANGVTLASGASNSINNLIINGSSALTLTATGGGTLTVAAGLTNNGTLTVGATRVLDVTGTFTNNLTLTNAGEIVVK
jgi:hypothetical protein